MEPAMTLTEYLPYAANVAVMLSATVAFLTFFISKHPSIHISYVLAGKEKDYVMLWIANEGEMVVRDLTLSIRAGSKPKVEKAPAWIDFEKHFMRPFDIGPKMSYRIPLMCIRSEDLRDAAENEELSAIENYLESITYRYKYKWLVPWFKWAGKSKASVTPFKGQWIGHRIRNNKEVVFPACEFYAPIQQKW